jgi:hypothetical protein
MNIHQQQDYDLLLFWENHFRKHGQVAKADDYLRRAREFKKPKGKRLKVYTHTPKFVPICFTDPNTGERELEGFAELLEKVYEDEATQRWSIKFAGQEQIFTRVIPHSEAESIGISAKPKKAFTPIVRESVPLAELINHKETAKLDDSLDPEARKKLMRKLRRQIRRAAKAAQD